MQFKSLTRFLKEIKNPGRKTHSVAFRIDKKNTRVAVSLLSELINHSKRHIKWQNTDLSGIVQKIEKSSKSSAKLISRNFPFSCSKSLSEYLSWIGQYIGENRNSTHGLSLVNKVFIPRLSEVQVTQGLVECFVSGDRMEQYNKILCLLNALPVSAGLLSDFISLPEQRKFILEADYEVQTKKGKRIDILIQWRSEIGTRAVAIEAKFGHSVTAGQLPAYKYYCKHEKNFDSFELILLTLDGHKNKKNRDWKSLSWLTFLTRLEKQLGRMRCDDLIFTSFRAMVWQRIRGRNQ